MSSVNTCSRLRRSSVSRRGSELISSGTILVVPSPWHATADASGGFEIRGVPPGRYRLWVWNDRLPRVARPIRVDAGAVVSLAVSIGAGQETPASVGKP